jgi:uroporphyrinogen-III synthase
LEQLGAQVIECPMIQIIPPADWTVVDAAIRRLDTYHWILFTSANAVDSFMRRVEMVTSACNVPVAAVGSATEARLRHWNIRPAIIPEDFRAEGLLEAFPQNLSGVRILFPRAETARELLPDELRRRGAVVDIVTVYRTVKSETSAAGVRQIFANHRVDCIIFTSSSTVRHLAEIVGADLVSMLADTAVAVIGPVTGETAREAGLRPAIESPRAAIADLVRAIQDRLGA